MIVTYNIILFVHRSKNASPPGVYISENVNTIPSKATLIRNAKTSTAVPSALYDLPIHSGSIRLWIPECTAYLIQENFQQRPA